MCAIVAMQAGRHDKAQPTSSIAPTLAKNARMGHPRFRYRKERAAQDEGWATRHEAAEDRSGQEQIRESEASTVES